MLIFLTVVKELPMTLLLRPSRINLARSAQQTSSGFGRAAAPAIVLMLISVVPALVLLNRTRPDRIESIPE
ncbi:MAG: hypothetical protein R2855_10355 [Thermomicrobiales bacterium]